MIRVHFVCIGNCCRSQMAEGFANHLGRGVVQATSSGLAPTKEVAWETQATMRSKGIDISSHYPKKFDPYGTSDFDVLVNLSGFELPGKPVPPVEEWPVHDPYGQSAEVYLQSATEIERRVIALIQKLQ